MDILPRRKYGGELQELVKVPAKDVIPGKFYYIRMRNKDVSADIWGAKEDFIGQINVVDNIGTSFDAVYSRGADPRHGKPVWKRTPGKMILILKKAFSIKSMDNNTTFYVPRTGSA